MFYRISNTPLIRIITLTFPYADHEEEYDDQINILVYLHSLVTKKKKKEKKKRNEFFFISFFSLDVISHFVIIVSL